MSKIVLKSDRPIYTTLPEIYSEFCSLDRLTDSAYLVEFWEKIYIFWNHNLDNLLSFDGDYNKLTVNQLVSLAPFFGYSGSWFNTNWTKEQMIKMFYGVYHSPYIWRNRGSLTVLNYVMDALNIPGNLSKRSGFIAGISMAGDICGSPDQGEYIMYIPENMNPNAYDALMWVSSRFIPLHIHVELVPTSDVSLVTRPNSN